MLSSCRQRLPCPLQRSPRPCPARSSPPSWAGAFGLRTTFWVRGYPDGTQRVCVHSGYSRVLTSEERHPEARANVSVGSLEGIPAPSRGATHPWCQTPGRGLVPLPRPAADPQNNESRSSRATHAARAAYSPEDVVRVPDILEDVPAHAILRHVWRPVPRWKQNARC